MQKVRYKKRTLDIVVTQKVIAVQRLKCGAECASLDEFRFAHPTLARVRIDSKCIEVFGACGIEVLRVAESADF